MNKERKAIEKMEGKSWYKGKEIMDIEKRSLELVRDATDLKKRSHWYKRRKVIGTKKENGAMNIKEEMSWLSRKGSHWYKRRKVSVFFN